MKADPAQAHQLITIPISHYCEKARWALERAAIPFVERAHLQILHRVAARRAGGGRTVPVLVSPDGVLPDSSAILSYADHKVSEQRRLYPADSTLEQVRALSDDFDRVLGPEGRRWMYHAMFDQKRLIRDYGATGVPAWERRLLPLIWVGATPLIRRQLKINDRTAARALGRVQQVFDGVAARLSDGRRFLTGERFTAADLTFAALSASVVIPEAYGVPLPPPALLPEPMRSLVGEFRAHPAGRFSLRLYAEER